MRISLAQSGHIARKIAIEIANNSTIFIEKNMDQLAEVAQTIIEDDLKWEKSIEERVTQIIENQVRQERERTIEYDYANDREIFAMIKKKIAKDEDFPMNFEDRFDQLSYNILDEFLDQSLISFNAPKPFVKNIIFDAIQQYLKEKVLIEDIVAKKIRNFKRKLIQGTDEYDEVYQQLFETELRARGFQK